VSPRSDRPTPSLSKAVQKREGHADHFIIRHTWSGPAQCKGHSSYVETGRGNVERQCYHEVKRNSGRVAVSSGRVRRRGTIFRKQIQRNQKRIPEDPRNQKPEAPQGPPKKSSKSETSKPIVNACKINVFGVRNLATPGSAPGKTRKRKITHFFH